MALAVLLSQTQPPPAASAIVGRYVQALGGEAAIRSINTRMTEGEYDNGGGLTTRFRSIEQAPDKRVTLIGTAPIESPDGSGR